MAVLPVAPHFARFQSAEWRQFVAQFLVSIQTRKRMVEHSDWVIERSLTGFDFIEQSKLNSQSFYRCKLTALTYPEGAYGL
jgi:hypothetical protein